jgi:hypothetical protein
MFLVFHLRRPDVLPVGDLHLWRSGPAIPVAPCKSRQSGPPARDSGEISIHPMLISPESPPRRRFAAIYMVPGRARTPKHHLVHAILNARRKPA